MGGYQCPIGYCSSTLAIKKSVKRHFLSLHSDLVPFLVKEDKIVNNLNYERCFLFNQDGLNESEICDNSIPLQINNLNPEQIDKNSDFCNESMDFDELFHNELNQPISVKLVKVKWFKIKMTRWLMIK